MLPSSSAVIENVDGMCAAGPAIMAYYYFDYGDDKKQNCYGLLSSLVLQLSTKSDHYSDILSQLYSSYPGGIRSPTISVLKKCMKDMLSLPGQDQIYIIVDALNACPDVSIPSAREEVLDLIEELAQMSLSNFHLCVSSTPTESDIRDRLEPLKPLQICLHDEPGQKNALTKYIDSVVHSDRRMQSWSPEEKKVVANVLAKKADGM